MFNNRSVNITLKLCLRIVSLVAIMGAANIGYAQQLLATIDTSKGVIVVELNERAAPTSVANFINLSLRGFYDGLTFHRVERNFMIQGLTALHGISSMKNPEMPSRQLCKPLSKSQNPPRTLLECKKGRRQDQGTPTTI